MTRTAATVAVLLGLFAGSCSSDLGRDVLECGPGTENVSNTLILAAQSVPGSDYLPCVVGLKPGWEYQHLIAETGRAQFTIDSDRMGSAFLVVTLVQSCDPGEAEPLPSQPAPGVDRYKEVFEASVEIPVTVIPVADRHYDYAENVAFVYGQETFDGRRVVTEVDVSTEPMANRITAAYEEGRHVVIVDDADVQEFTVGLRLIGEDERPGMDRSEALAEIADEAETANYRARWFDVFAGGCVLYDFDAKGPGTETVARDGMRSLSLYPLEPLRQVARDAGYRGLD